MITHIGNYLIPCSCCFQNDDADVTEPFKRQGSFRKVLPSADAQLSMSAKMIDRPAVSTRGNQKVYTQYQLEYNIISE